MPPLRRQSRAHNPKYKLTKINPTPTLQNGRSWFPEDNLHNAPVACHFKFTRMVPTTWLRISRVNPPDIVCTSEPASGYGKTSTRTSVPVLKASNEKTAEAVLFATSLVIA